MTLRRMVLLRHGETDFNVEGRMQGHLDSRLTDAGRKQIRRAAPVLARLRPERLLSSDLQRAPETGDEVGAACGIPVKVDPRLRETHLGRWQGRTAAEIEESRPGAIAAWRSSRPPSSSGWSEGWPCFSTTATCRTPEFLPSPASGSRRRSARRPSRSRWIGHATSM